VVSSGSKLNISGSMLIFGWTTHHNVPKTNLTILSW